MSDEIFRAVVIDVDGHRTVMEWTPSTTDDETGLLALLQRAVGGYIELVQLSRDLSMWVNEEGAFMLPPNTYARWFGSFFNWDVRFYGDVVLTGGGDGEETIGLTTEQVEGILAWPWPKPVETVDLSGLSGENDTTKRESE